MKKITGLIFCVWLLPSIAFSQQKILRASPAYDNIQLEKIGSPMKFAKYALIENDRQQQSVYHPEFCSGMVSTNKTFISPLPYDFGRGIHKMKRATLYSNYLPTPIKQ